MFTSLHLYEMFILSIYTNCLFLSRTFYEFTVVAEERFDRLRTGTTTVYVTVEDSNDHAPQFVGAPFTFTIEENVPAGEIIGRVNASDADAGSNEQVS